jgi:hypothetical protein
VEQYLQGNKEIKKVFLLQNKLFFLEIKIHRTRLELATKPHVLTRYENNQTKKLFTNING